MPRLEVEGARERFGSVPVVRLATVGAGGGPHVVPSTFVVDGDMIFMAVDHKPKASRRLRRLANIAAEPRVSVLADHYENDWDRLWWVRADGEAEVLDSPASMAGPVRLLRERYPQYVERVPEGPVIAVTVTRWTGWAYRD